MTSKMTPKASKKLQGCPAWIPSYRRECELEECEKLKRQFQSFLNKIALQNFNILQLQLKTFDIESEDKQRLFAHLIFENGITVWDPHFTVFYASLCQHLESINGQRTKDEEEKIVIVSSIIDLCQNEVKNNWLDFDKEEIKTLSSEDLVKRCHRCRIRKLGALRLLGELYNLDMLNGDIIHTIVKSNLELRSDESLECLSVLLRTVITTCEKRSYMYPDEKSQVDEYYLQIRKILEKPNLNLRIRFLLLDLLEKRKMVSSIAVKKSKGGETTRLCGSANVWKPSHRREYTADEYENLKLLVQSVFNKLTLQKFMILISQLKQINMDTEGKLNLFVDLLFENAVNEPRFSVLYANVCKHLENVKVLSKDEHGKEISIVSLVIDKCQNELKNIRFDLKEEAANNVCMNEVILKQEKDRITFRRRKLGTLRLLGELYKLEIPIFSMIDHIIKSCLNTESEESLECSCVLLRTVGKALDLGNATSDAISSNTVDCYFKDIQRILEESRLSARIRFMLLDLIDLRENFWIPRRMEGVLKTIDEIHEEAKAEYESNQRHKKYKHSSKRRPRKSKGFAEKSN